MQLRIPNRAPVQRTIVIPAPIGGLNTRDALELMPAIDAVAMTNWDPRIGSVSVRSGFTAHQASVGSGNVDTLAEYNAGATRKLLAASNGNIYDATSTPSSLGSGFSSDRWQWAMLGSTMGLVNGADAPRTFDGSSLGTMTVSGPTVADLSGVMVHRSRSYFWTAADQSFWFSAVNAMGGSLTEFPLGRVGNFGGNLICAGSWNVEGGESNWGGGGIGEDMAVFVMSSGEIVVYRGDDPGSNFDLVGVYTAGAPVDIRGIERRGADLLILTTEGLISLAALVRAGAFDPGSALSDKIRPTLVDLVDTYKANTGWQVIHYPGDNKILLNVPTSTTVFHQYVMNTQTGAWAKWTGIPSRCWARYNDGLYFGDTGANVRNLTGNADISTAIEADVQSAYSPLAGRGNICRVSAVRPLLRGLEAASIGVLVQYDFSQVAADLVTVSFGPSADTWEEDEIKWEDDDSNWESVLTEVQPFSEWFAAEGQGYTAGVRLTATADAELRLETITYQVEAGQGFI